MSADIKNILLTGGAGFIGSKVYQRGVQHHWVLLQHRTKLQAERVITDLGELTPDTSIDVIINLAGAPINRYWTSRSKAKIRHSRIETTRQLVNLVARLEQKPEVLISGSAIGYYGDCGARSVTEECAGQDGFAATLCRDWEEAAAEVTQHNVRLCLLRLGVVLGAEGFMAQVLPVFRQGFGGCLGSGRQYFSWIHIVDVIRAVDFLISNKDAHGVYNLTAPVPVTNSGFTEQLSQMLRVSARCHLPRWLITLLFGEMGTALLLGGQKVLPTRLQKSGFAFKYPQLYLALQDLLVQS